MNDGYRRSVPQKNSTFLVVVTYFPDDGFLIRLEKMAKLFCRVIVVDNGGTLSESVVQDNVSLIILEKNSGLAAGLNRGIRCALLRGAEWIVTLDQDSLLSERFLASCAQAISLRDHIFILGANYCTPEGRKKFRGGDYGVGRAKTVITSGMLVHKTVFDKVGLMREEFFIDSIDHEFCLRARRSGFYVYFNLEVAMTHSIGDYQSRTLFGTPIYKSSLRRYTISRNGVVTILEYAGSDPMWALKRFAGLFLEFSVILVCEKNKLERIGLFFKGLMHGLMRNFDVS